MGAQAPNLTHESHLRGEVRVKVDPGGDSITKELDMAKECYVKCDNGFVSTIRDIGRSNLQNIHSDNGLTKPGFISGNVYYFYSMCIQLVNMGVATE